MNVELLNQCASASFDGTMIFPEIVAELTREGVEWYSANLLFRMTTYYAADGGHHQVPWPPALLPPIADMFEDGQVGAAIRASQRQEIRYPEFLRRIAAAGAVYYTVHVKGKKAIYFGRHGDFHVEPFPRARPVATVAELAPRT
jgi:uncharacterized protein YbcV (DUF1398 family)